MKVTIDGTEHEITQDDLSLDDGYALITPDNVPDGYYTQDALESKIKTRLSKAEDNVKDRLKDDQSFHKSVLDKYGVSLGADGKPKGLKPEVDIDEVKQNVAQQLREEYEAKIAEKDNKLNAFINKGLKNAISEGAQAIGIDDKFLNPLVEGGDPYLVKELSDKFKYNADIDDYALLEDDGTFKVDGNGVVTTKKFFEKNTDRFKDMLKDNRQRGSQFNGQGSANTSRPKGNPADWGRDTKLKYIAENGRDGYKEAIQSFKKTSKEE